MKINEIIKERRIDQGLTQEQVAEALGVSTPAVNKWEKGISYPDITILPALARLLRVDLNTFFAFL
ncbi:helix-turn-helix domain-containing protein [Clostridium tertium]|uniref:helix-turn-helix domain-containing protein n=1 Tax=Clostridium tertium TaxID=1559 RepID=UPI00232F8BC4|nr:helix-turn-helix transcriptional regulator [Clostridium tertium]MDB1939526.1 helix-turn-helix transcriptional regulator [Clostridium tertium]